LWDLPRLAIFGYVKGLYNLERIQERLGYRSSADFESGSVAKQDVDNEPGQLRTTVGDDGAKVWNERELPQTGSVRSKVYDLESKPKWLVI
jgi:hypothetical protein